jgi:Na+-driven multidrug efflux pump
MKALSNPARRRRRVAIDAVMVLVILVLMVQMWLLTATLESYLAGHHRVAIPALLSSLALFAVCFFLYRLVLRIDRLQEPEESEPSPAMPGPWHVGGEVRPSQAAHYRGHEFGGQ